MFVPFFASRKRQKLRRLCGDFPASVVFKSFTLFPTFSFLPAPEASPMARVETIWLTRAGKDEGRTVCCRFLVDFDGPRLGARCEAERN
jgi:hypothetical protein